MIVILYGETVMLLGFICFCILKEFFLNENFLFFFVLN
jgi:hypothetical protein